jgi:hypothetical protein
MIEAIVGVSLMVNYYSQVAWCYNDCMLVTFIDVLDGKFQVVLQSTLP